MLKYLQIVFKLFCYCFIQLDIAAQYRYLSIDLFYFFMGVYFFFIFSLLLFYVPLICSLECVKIFYECVCVQIFPTTTTTVLQTDAATSHNTLSIGIIPPIFFIALVHMIKQDLPTLFTVPVLVLHLLLNIGQIL